MTLHAKQLYPLLHHLATVPQNGRFGNWRYQPLGHGRNNRLYRATNERDDLVIKFTIRDARRRAHREFQALRAVQQRGLSLAPQPLLLDESTFSLPVVVQRWQAGAVSESPPQTEADWERLLAFYASLTNITPANMTVPVPQAVISFSDKRQGLHVVRTQAAVIPQIHQPTCLRALLACLPSWAEAAVFPPQPPVLCHADSNPLNFIRQPQRWLAVDWENSGWGDITFEIVDLMAHPQYQAVPWARWEWVMAQFAAQVGDETAVSRIRSLYPLMLVWWVARLATALYEVPRGGDQRLVRRPPDWQETTQALMLAYAEKAAAALAELNRG